ncbi:hypothetical protein L13192_06636 [Pyrenophora tritici-repentis]|uniref:Uncharacterized protein n=1 Tax=Pyrenophora tritici-repentis (strain Pt-1C-BFP) TaxID=426418 RepID=B2WHX1_PYRTR|nr:uncharacterized protein PTRG_09580 [Pyrenophora tritici-repentis Pt-1C-BFP]EDU42631.1 predicted protein [Pyrenophora tritici-repentis Pt-1C-BFP]KAI1669177.1 hypothetical protein L13192_06636 [Pyrenophora tritici-repentis]KAI1683968.1 hypothetical protein KJE20_06473 [Pyrenophora tritici-repentis]
MVPQTYLHRSLLLYLLASTTFTQGDEAKDDITSPTHLPSNSRSAISPPPSAACWTTTPCLNTLAPFSTCYLTTGPLTPTLNLTSLSLSYQACLCAPSLPYLHLIPNIAAHPDSNVSSCLACMQQADVNVTDRDGVVGRWVRSVDGFCAAEVPELEGLLVALLEWLKGTGERVEGNSKLGGIEGVMSVLGVTATGTKMMDMERYLTQVPHNWPYTAPAVARRAGVTTRFALVEASESGSTTPIGLEETKVPRTVGWVEASLLWFPRLLYTPRPPSPSSPSANQTARAGAYNGLLACWKPSFVVNITTTAMESTEQISTSDTPVGGSEGSGLPTFESLLSSTATTSTTTSTSRRIVRLTTTLVVDTAQVMTPTVTITSTATLHRVRPAMRRGPVLAKESDKGDVASTATRSGVMTPPPPTPTTAGGQQAPTRATISLNGAEEIDRLWSQIKHAMHSNLNP